VVAELHNCHKYPCPFVSVVIMLDDICAFQHHKDRSMVNRFTASWLLHAHQALSHFLCCPMQCLK
jgi:hypothetical protein